MSPDTGVIVVGMHRSGTSATARLINLLGVPIGDRDDLKPPNEANATGYWESNSLTAFNDRLLRFLGGSWAAPPLLGAGWERAPALARHRAQALEVFRCVNRGRQWVWKDPRASLTMPFWLYVLGVRPVIVLTHRNPLEVARSLRDRDGIRKRLALAIWERYSRAALAAVRGLPVFVLPYDALTADPLAWSKHLCTFLRIHRMGCSPVAARREAPSFIERSLHHHVLPRESLRRDRHVSPAQRYIAAFLDSLAGGHGVFPACALPPEPERIEGLLSAQRRRDLARWSDEVRHGPIDRQFALQLPATVTAELRP